MQQADAERQILVVVNPAAGGRRGLRRFEAIRTMVTAWPGNVTIRCTGGRGDAEAMAGAAGADGVDLLVAAGGDGTVHEVVNGLLQGATPRPALAILALGTGCDFARNLGLGPAVVARPPVREVVIDVGHVRCVADGAPRDRYFVNAANMGASPDAARRVAASVWLRRTGAAAYVLAGLPEVVRRPCFDVQWRTADASVVTEQLLNLTVCNGARFGGGLSLVPNASLSDGRLHLARVRHASLFAVLRTLASGYSDPCTVPDGVSAEAVTRLQVEGESWIEIDGEIAGSLPATFAVLPRALRVLLP